MGQIRISKLRAEAIIGTYDHEREEPQELFITLEVEVDDEASLTDDISYALDYEALCQTVREQVANTSYYLIERLAAFILDLVVQHPKALHATVRVDKPGAIPEAEMISYEISSLI